MGLLSCLVKYMLKCLSESIAFCVDYLYEEITVIVIIKYFLHSCENYVFFAEKVYDCTKEERNWMCILLPVKSVAFPKLVSKLDT